MVFHYLPTVGPHFDELPLKISLHFGVVFSFFKYTRESTTTTAVNLGYYGNVQDTVCLKFSDSKHTALMRLNILATKLLPSPILTLFLFLFLSFSF